MDKNLAKQKISVIIPTHNASFTIEKCLSSVLNQDYQNMDVIVVDDASCDDTLENVSKFKVKVIANSKNYGAAHSRNVGVENTDSEIVIFVDSDVTIQPNALSYVSKKFLNNPEILAIGGIYSENTKHLNFVSDFKNLELAYRGALKTRYVKYLGSFFLAIRKETFLQSGGFSTEFGGSSVEDIEFGYRVSKGRNVLLSDTNIQIDHLKKYTLITMLKVVFKRIFNMIRIIKNSKGKNKAGEHAPITQFMNIFLPGLIFFSFIVGIVFNINWLCPLLILIFIINNTGFIYYLIKKRDIIFAIKSIFIIFIEYIVVEFSIFLSMVIFSLRFKKQQKV